MEAVQLWLMVGISATLFVAFVIVTILVLMDLVGWVNLPVEVAKPLRSTLVLQFAVIAVGAVASLLAPNLIQQALYHTARDVGSVSAADAPTEEAPVPVATSSTSSSSIGCARNDLKPLLYIQFPGEAQRSVAEAIQADASAAGWLAPGVEQVTAYTRPETQLRYFRAEEVGDAQGIAASLVAAGHMPANAELVLVKADVRQCQFEVWLGTQVS